MFRILLLAAAIGFAADDGPAIREALAALQRGDFPAAEKTLRAEVKLHPADAGALTLLGVSLDSQRKFQEAAEIHQRAVASAPQSIDVLNNYANHLLAMGDEEGARKLYQRILGLDAANRNAGIQLARLAVRRRNGTEALHYLERVPDAPNLAPLKLEALYLSGQTAEADRLCRQWLAAAKSDLGASFSFGVALADAGKYDEAEQFFSQALALSPSDFNLLFNLGVVAWHTGHLERAREVLESAQKQQPRNVDMLYTLACVDQAAHHPEAAVAVLALAARLAPQRSDIQKLLALATGDLGALDDAAAAWDRYVKLEPNDDVGRRERGFTAFQRGHFEEGVADLRWFVARHPEDAVGHYELGSAVNKDNPAQALAEFDRAIALQPDFAAARSARGSLYYQMGKPEAALTDLEAAAAGHPDDAVSLDRLGQTYLSLDRAADAVRVLRTAARLAPDDSKTQLHLARALADNGQAAESKAAMDRFRQLGPAVQRGVPGGLVDYLSLTPEQRRADYRARLERLVREHPEDAAGQASYLKLLLEDGDARGAAETARRIGILKPAPSVLADAGRALLWAGQYQAARDLLQHAPPAGMTAELRMELALACFHESGPTEGMRLLDQVANSERGSDYYLARAEMLDAAGERSEASIALQHALDASPRQPDVYLQACNFLLRNGNAGEALRISDEAMKAIPQDRQILLLRAVVLQRSGRPQEALQVFQQVQNRWPEWPAGWTGEGLIEGAAGRREASIAALGTAVRLGETDAEVKRYLSSMAAGTKSEPPDVARLLTIQQPRQR